MAPLVQAKRVEITSICHDHHVRRLELFGSAANGSFDLDGSDLDFLVEFEPGTPVEHATRYFSLLAALQDLFQREVDLVEMQAIRNPYLLNGIQPDRTLVYAA